MVFELATWYDTWNKTGLDNLVQRKVPLNYATRYNLAFGIFEACPPGILRQGYTLTLNGAYASLIIAEIRNQTPPGILIYAGTDPGGTGLSAIVADNRENKNRSTANVVAYLKDRGLNGIAIDAEEAGMSDVPELVAQLGPSFKKEGLGIAVSAPWPGGGPTSLYGENAVAAFNQHVDAIELQDYSSSGTPSDVQTWIDAKIRPAILMGGVCTENSDVQTPLPTVTAWTKFALEKKLRGMFSWRLDNDHGLQGEHEDVEPTFTGAKTLYDTVHDGAGVAAGV
jgi:hypothetical protein